ncbi:hypothetical protein UVI_02011300 [Ustilaginoidea virens]|uniref:Uncharacterized protein n=1 Tax=Ustilaginoidea virens TaxID=1159556 RepID=A0A1B5L2Y8_USTVR|nr:hypothetical protein UVI_02011300 [Ustilaginoidea virens]
MASRLDAKVVRQRFGKRHKRLGKRFQSLGSSLLAVGGFVFVEKCPKRDA